MLFSYLDISFKIIFMIPIINKLGVDNMGIIGYCQIVGRRETRGYHPFLLNDYLLKLKTIGVL